MSKEKQIAITLTLPEANALMVMLDFSMEFDFLHEPIDLENWETMDMDAYKMLAFHKYKTWYKENV